MVEVLAVERRTTQCTGPRLALLAPAGDRGRYAAMRTNPLVRALVLIGVALCAGASHAAGEEEWKFVFAMASVNWDIRSGTAMFARSGSLITGKFGDAKGVEYEFSAKLTGSNATGRLVIIGSDGGPFDMKGVYTRRKTLGVSPCLWQTIQLSDGFNFFGLLRTEDKCKP